MKGKCAFSSSLAQSRAPPNDHIDRCSLLSSLVARRRGEWRVGTSSLGLLSSFSSIHLLFISSFAVVVCGHTGALGSSSRRLVPRVCGISHITFLDSWSAEVAFDWGFGDFLPFVRGSLVVDTTTTTTAISLASRASCVPSLVRALASEGTFLQSVPSLGAPNTDLREEGRAKRQNIEAS